MLSINWTPYRGAPSSHKRSVVLPLLIIWLCWSSASICLAGNMAAGFKAIDSAASIATAQHCDHENGETVVEQLNCCDDSNNLPAIGSGFEFDPAVQYAFIASPSFVSLRDSKAAAVIDISPPDPIASIFLRVCTFLI